MTVSDSRTISVALQGGGADGAFGWGALDRILEDQRIDIEALTGTSSGAVNAALAAYGMMDGGREGARALLESFWRELSRAFREHPWSKVSLLRILLTLRRGPLSQRTFMELMGRLASPYRLDPETMDPIRSVIDQHIDFEKLRADSSVKLFVNATDVRTGDVRIFDRSEISLDAICASACIPLLFEPVRIGQEAYWDGGYLGNPPIFPLIYHASTSDILLIRTGPVGAQALPRTPTELLERVFEVTFSSTFVREMRAIELISRLVTEEKIGPDAGVRDIRTHLIGAEKSPDASDSPSKLNPDWESIERNRDRGYEAADRWLAESFHDIGQRTTADLQSLSLASPEITPRRS
ncbi:MAG: patatin-like phospholipase family protein [Deltaproteobacteria bacterium]|nr:patatin-like phospholipase family protein [Deltaproteobacteria bacterium]MBW2421007.1 patatin-like phospholipase family protein [Deltaproteobacteria bacterium]